MPRIRVNGAELHYEEAGSGPETIVFAHGLLMSSQMFAAQLDALRGRYRCISFDFRGQGQSEVTPGGYDMDALTEDTVKLIAALGAGPCHFVGLSMGGFVGMRLAARHAGLLRSLVLMDTAAGTEPHWFRYHILRFCARWFGVASVANKVMPILFARKFLDDPARSELREAWRSRLLRNDRIGVHRAAKGVIDRRGCEDLLSGINVPTLIVVGEEDVATPPEKARFLHERIKGSRLVIIPGAGHSASVEEPAAVTETLLRFFQGIETSGGQK